MIAEAVVDVASCAFGAPFPCGPCAECLAECDRLIAQLPKEPTAMQSETVPSAHYLDAPIDQLIESTWNPRKHYDDAKLRELADSVRSKGVVEPIVVRPVLPGTKAFVGGARFEIVAGSRRFRASKMAARDSVPAIVRDLDDVAALELAIIENGQRDDVHPLDEAAGYQALMQADRAFSVAVIAAKVDKAESYVYRRLKLLSLIPIVARAFEHDRMTVAHAERLARLTPALQRQAYDHELYHPFYMFDAEQELKAKDERLPDRDALRPLAELDSWIRKHSAIDLASADTPQYFPELADAVADQDAASDAGDADDTAPAAAAPALLELSTDHFVRQELGLGKTAPAPIAAPRWKAIKSAKDRCAHATRGVITHGDRPRVLEVCATKGCPKHFPVKRRPKSSAGSSTAKQSKPTETPWERDNRLRKERREAFAPVWPEVKAKLVDHFAKTKLTPALLRTVFQIGDDVGEYDLKQVREQFGIEASDEMFGQAIALIPFLHIDERPELSKPAGAFKFDLKWVDVRLKQIADEKKAAEKAAAKAPPAKAASGSAAKSNSAKKKGGAK